MSLWFLARADELLLDLDRFSSPTPSGLTWGELYFRRRLRRAMEAGVLRVRSVYLAPSHREGHVHAAVTLDGPMPILERIGWQSHLGSDLYRSRADWMRAARAIVKAIEASAPFATPEVVEDAAEAAAPTLLIRSAPFHRAPDFTCACTEKHLTASPPDCDVWRRLRGATPWEMFGPTAPEAGEVPVPLPMGNVPLDRVLARVAAPTEPELPFPGGTP